ncbi:MAG: GNAT family N-acetyltransferase [Methylobacteriaceae bacterium]|nr:GNAT family N-acetyltransferase [Methylobacteriaceae bacterium]
MDDPAEVRLLEELCFNAWPALTTALVDGWVVRLSDGHTRRANSASALWPSRIAPEALVETVEGLFAARNLTPLFRLTVLADPAVEPLLRGRGWREEDPSIGMVADLAEASPAAPDVALSARLEASWIDGAMAAYGMGEKGAASLRRMLPNITPKHVYATAHDENGAAVGWGLAVAERGHVGLYDLVVAAPARGRGHGARMIAALTGWGRSQGARRAYLQVREGNAGARALYRRLGFRDAYRYIQLRASA